MGNALEDLCFKSPKLRRLVWRIGRRLYTSARGEQIAAEIETDGEGYLQDCVVRSAGSNERLVVLDIGANQGDWTRRLLKTIPGTRRGKQNIAIELFEPVPATRERLLTMLRQEDDNGVCTVHPIAISDKSGSFDMAVMSATGGTNSLHFGGSAEAPPGGWVKVETQTLTELFAARGLAKAHLVKCDTEGHDLKVLQGARDLLAARRINVFQFEYNHRWVHSRSFLKDVFDLIAGLPYRLGRVEPTSIELLAEWHPELDRFFQSNYVLIAEDSLSWFNLHRGTFDGSNTYA